MVATIRDAFNPNLWKAVSMTEKVNLAERSSTEIRDSKIFDEILLTTRWISLERVRDAVQLVKSTPRGTPGQQRRKDKRSALAFETVRYAEEASITKDELTDVFAAGPESFLKNLDNEQNVMAGKIARDLDHTEEFIFQGALKGLVLDADMTVLYDLYEMFGFDKPDPSILDISGTQTLKAYLQAVRRTMAAALGQDGQAGFVIEARVGNDFYDHIAGLAEVEKAFDRPQDGAFLREGGVAYEGFTYAGITFKNIQPSDDGVIGVAPEKIHFYPKVKGLYKAFYSPSDRLDETLGGAALQRYAFADVDKKNRFVDVEGQMNLVAMMAKPLALIEGELG